MAYKIHPEVRTGNEFKYGKRKEKSLVFGKL
jgi:hypothetical protein